MFVGTVRLPARSVRLGALTIPTSPPLVVSDTTLMLGGASVGLLLLALFLRRGRGGRGSDAAARRARRIGSIARAAALESAA